MSFPMGVKSRETSCMTFTSTTFFPITPASRKSQELAALQNKNNPAEDIPEWKKPDWVPESYGKVIELAQQEMLASLERTQQQKQEQRQAAETAVNAQLEEIKAKEPSLSEELLFQHANKYQFKDLRVAFQNMQDMKLAVKSTEANVLKNLQQRASDPIAGRPGAGAAAGEGIPYGSYNNESAQEYLRRIKS
jgi:hypothetical protein